MGEGDQRLHLLDAWQESPFYGDRERAGLSWCEAVTRITEGRVPDEVYELARAQFSETELVNLTLAIVAINAANRLNIAFAPCREATGRGAQPRRPQSRGQAPPSGRKIITKPGWAKSYKQASLWETSCHGQQLQPQAAISRNGRHGLGQCAI
jgi:hypothetical protein